MENKKKNSVSKRISIEGTAYATTTQSEFIFSRRKEWQTFEGLKNRNIKFRPN